MEMPRICVSVSQDELLPFPGWTLPIIAHVSIGSCRPPCGSECWSLWLMHWTSGATVSRSILVRRNGAAGPRHNLHLCHHSCSTHDPISPTLRCPRLADIYWILSTWLFSRGFCRGWPLVAINMWYTAYSSVVLGTFTELGKHHYNPILEHFITWERNPAPFSNYSPFLLLSPSPLPQPQATTHLLSVSMDWSLLGIPPKWSHIMCVLFCVWFLSLNIIFSRFIHVVACVSTSWFLLPNDRPLYGYTFF